MWGLVREGGSALLGLVLPRTCAACGQSDPAAQPLCRTCAEAFLGLVATPYCPRCGSSLGEGLPVEESGCAQCPTPMPRFDRVVRLGPYESALAEMIRSLKFHGQHQARRWLGRILAEKVRSEPALAEVEAVQPVPLHWLRLLRRGYNQSAMVAAGLAKAIGLPVMSELVRIRNTAPQVGLPRSRRLANVKGAFVVARPKAVAGLHVMLVDDVTTTGATASEASRALLRAGASRVSLAVLAKSDPPTAFVPRHG